MTIRFFVLFLFASGHVCAQKTNERPFAISEIPVSPLAAALGGSHVAAFRGDINQLATNPGLLDSAIHGAASFTYLNYLAGVNQGTVSYARMKDSFGLVSGYFRFLNYGTFTETDESGNELRQFTLSETELGVSLTRPYTERIAYGVTVKQFMSTGFRTIAYGVAADFGASYHGEKGFEAGAVLDNLGVRIAEKGGDSLGWFRPGLHMAMTKKFARAPIILGVQYSHIETWDLAAFDSDALNRLKTDPLTGEMTRSKFTADNLARHLSLSATLVPSHAFNVIIGYNFRRRLEFSNAARPASTGFSFGTRIAIKKFQLQYALSSYHLGATTHHLGITTNLSQQVRKKPLS